MNKTTPDGKPARGPVSAFDPLTGATEWEVEYPQPPLASLLSTKGNLVFVPDARGWLHALDASTGRELWSHNNGQGHNGGIISYMAKGKQYVAVATGWDGLAGDEHKVIWGEPWTSMPIDQGMVVVFSLIDSVGRSGFGPTDSQDGGGERCFPPVVSGASMRSPSALQPCCSSASASVSAPAQGPMSSGYKAPAAQTRQGPQFMGTTLTDAEIADRIKHGKPGQMPAFADAFSDDDIKAIIRYIRELKED